MERHEGRRPRGTAHDHFAAGAQGGRREELGRAHRRHRAAAKSFLGHEAEAQCAPLQGIEQADWLAADPDDVKWNGTPESVGLPKLQGAGAYYTLDAGKCISYLTIEYRGVIPLELRRPIGNRIFGCDDCQLVCPWNRYAQASQEAAFTPRHAFDGPDLLDLWAWDETTWLKQTEGMPLRRMNYASWLRNLSIALGNAPQSPDILAALTLRRTTLTDSGQLDAVLSEHIEWAIAEQSA